MATKQDEYSKQKDWKRSFLPTAPPSYSSSIGNEIAVNQSLYPIPSNFPSETMVASAVPHLSDIYTEVTVPIIVGPNSARVECPGCRNSVKTKIKSVSQKSAFIACFILCLLGCCLCSCVPHCMKSFQDVHHYCPECNTYIGTYKN